MNGLDFRRELARAGIATPIIFLTGDIDHGEGHQVHAAGVARRRRSSLVFTSTCPAPFRQTSIRPRSRARRRRPVSRLKRRARMTRSCSSISTCTTRSGRARARTIGDSIRQPSSGVGGAAVRGWESEHVGGAQEPAGGAPVRRVGLWHGADPRAATRGQATRLGRGGQGRVRFTPTPPARPNPRRARRRAGPRGGAAASRLRAD